MITLFSTGVDKQPEVLLVRLYVFTLHVYVEKIESSPKVPTTKELTHLAEVV